MHENERALVRAAIWYCSTLGRTVNSLASVYAAGVSAGPEMLHIAGVHDEDGLDDFRQTVAADFRAELKKAIKSGCSAFVISSEHLHSRITTEQQIEQLKSLWAGFGVSEECILFLRPQADLARSLQSAAAPSGGEVSQKRYLTTANGPYFEYFDIYKRHHSTVEWFCNHVGINRNNLTIRSKGRTWRSMFQRSQFSTRSTRSRIPVSDTSATNQRASSSYFLQRCWTVFTTSLGIGLCPSTPALRSK